MSPSLLMLATMLAAAPAPDGGTEAAGSTGDRLKELERRVEILSEQLEAQSTQGAAPPAAAPVSPGLGPGASKVYALPGGLSVGGYGETVFSAYATHLESGERAPVDRVADTLRAVLYVGYKFTDWLVFNSEYEWEHAGLSDEHPVGEAIVEFAYLDFLLSRGVSVRAGHLLLPIGFINELHEPPTFFGVYRPALESEGGLIPTTWHETGLGLHGDLPANLSYRLYLVNGLDSSGFGPDGITGGRQDGHLAVANQPALTGRLDWHLTPGAFVGASFYGGNSAQGRGATPLWTTLVEAHGELQARGLRLRALLAYQRNGPAGVAALPVDAVARQVGTLQWGGYVEAGYDLFALARVPGQALLPFVRYERFNLQQELAPAAAATGAEDRSRLEVGASYLPVPQVVVKTDYDFDANAARTGRNQLNLGVGYLF